MLDFGEFDFANAQMGCAGRTETNERAYSASANRHQHDRIQWRNGFVYWSWSDSGTDADTLIKARSSWCFRLPLMKDGVEWGWLNLYRHFNSNALLVDTNYLSDLLRRELTTAVERILTNHEATLVAPPVLVKVHVKEMAG